MSFLGDLREDPEGSRCRVGALWARLFLRKGWALTAFQTIWFKREVDFQSYLRQPFWRYHEQRHLVQERELFKGNSFRYLMAFVWQYARFGHDRAPLEIDADQSAKARMNE